MPQIPRPTYSLNAPSLDPAPAPGDPKRRRPWIAIIVVALSIVVTGTLIGATMLGLVNPWILSFAYAGGAFALYFGGRRFMQRAVLRAIMAIVILGYVGLQLYLTFAPSILGTISSAGHSVTVTYEVTGSESSAMITLEPDTAGDVFNARLPLPFSRTVTIDPNTTASYDLDANLEDGTAKSQLSCTITVDGTTVAHDSATGRLSLVGCDALAK